jgi:hypothetical protein
LGEMSVHCRCRPDAVVAVVVAAVAA